LRLIFYVFCNANNMILFYDIKVNSFFSLIFLYFIKASENGEIEL
jgi:hypothetical protein